MVNDLGLLVDTYWASGCEAHVLTPDEATSAELIFKMNEYRELARYEEYTFVDHHPDDRRVLTSQHGHQRRLFIRRGATPDLGTKIANARNKVADAESALTRAESALASARDVLAALEAETRDHSRTS